MIAHVIYAQICDGIVQNIIQCTDNEYEFANQLARISYGDEAFAIDVTQCPCGIGDKYRDNGFFRTDENGEDIPVSYLPTAEEEVGMLAAENGEMKNRVTELQLALVDQYEENLALQEEVTNLQLALTELYEGIG